MKNSVVRINKLKTALRAAMRQIKADRDSLFESCTIAPDRSISHMNDIEKAALAKYDRLIARIASVIEG